MSEEQREEQRKKGFLSWVLGEEEDEEGTAIYSDEEVGVRDLDERQEPHGFTVERADEIIQNLPEDVPRASAVRIVRQTLSAAGIDVEDLRRSSSRREAKLSSEIEMSQGRIKEVREKTDEHVASLEQQIRKAREDRDSGVNKEEKRISRAQTGIEKVERVREFFGLPKEEEQPRQPQQRQQRPEQHQERRSRSSIGEETQAMEPVEPNEETQVIRRRGPLSEGQGSGEQGSERESSRGERGGGARRNRNPRGDRDR